MLEVFSSMRRVRRLASVVSSAVGATCSVHTCIRIERIYIEWISHDIVYVELIFVIAWRC